MTPAPGANAAMAWADHLCELRRRLLASLIGIGVAAIGGWFLVDPILARMQAPLVGLSGSGVALNFSTLGSALDLRISVAAWLGVLLAAPWWIFQLGAFIGPGLKRREKGFIAAFGLVGIILFAGGALSGMWVVPKAVSVLSTFTPDGAVMLLRADTYIQFFMRIVLAFGLSGLAPEVLVALNVFARVSARTLAKGWRWALVGAAVFSALANPLPSAWPMLLQMAALMALYGGALAIAATLDTVRARRH